MNIVFEALEPLSHSNRNRRGVYFNLLVTGGILLFLTFILNLWYASLIAFIFFIVQYLKSERTNRYFIYKIVIDNERVTIEYKEGDQKKEVIGKKEDFKLRKKTAFNRTQTSYLAIYYKNNLLIKQFEIGKWNEKVFNELTFTSEI